MHLKLKMLINIKSPRSYSINHTYLLFTCIFTGSRSIYKKNHYHTNMYFYREYLQEESQLNKFIHRVFTSHIYDMYFYREYLFLSNITHACIFLDICRTQHILYIHLVYFQRVFTSCRRQLMTMKSD